MPSWQVKPVAGEEVETRWALAPSLTETRIMPAQAWQSKLLPSPVSLTGLEEWQPICRLSVTVGFIYQTVGTASLM